MTMKSVDDLLFKSANDQQPEAILSTPEPSSLDLENQDNNTHSTDTENTEVAEQSETESTPEQPKKDIEQPSDSSLDEYGNPIGKQRLYTEEELQQRIRERVARVKVPQQEQIQQPVKQVQNDSEDGDWVSQLESVIDHRLEKKQQDRVAQQWQHEESQRQHAFEEKFSSGMSKYSDFQSVVAGKPITDTMMLASRSLDNPAAFVYGASKFHPQELERISRIPDAIAQASEVGRLHERMVKERNMISKAPKPIETIRGDMPSKSNQGPSLDDRINQHAKQKLRR